MCKKLLTHVKGNTAMSHWYTVANDCPTYKHLADAEITASAM